MSLLVLNKEDLRLRVQQVVGDDLAIVDKLLVSQFRNRHEFIQDICDHVSLYQGKRIRPLLLILCARMCRVSCETSRMEHTLGAVVEMIHMATLVHDDVIDDADLRRHVSTVHRRWNVETSVLLGDYLFSKAFHLAATTGDAESCRLIGRATDRTCEGELNQIAARLEQSVSERDYFRVIAGKTGQLFSVSCQLGGRAVDASPAGQTQLKQFGLRLGLAFQIADDILDLTQSQELTGKDAANDLQNGRLTLPLLRALRNADSHDRHQLLDMLQADQCDLRAVAEIPALQSGIESARITAEELVSRAVRNLHRFPKCEARCLLESIARFAIHRSA